MDILAYTAVLASTAVFVYYALTRFKPRRIAPKADSEFVLVKDICSNRWFLARFFRRSNLGNEWVEPKSGFVLYTPAKPSRTDVVIGNKVVPAIEAIGCSPIFSTGDLAEFLKSLSVAEVAVGNVVIDATSPTALQQLYSFLESAYSEKFSKGWRVWTARRGGVRLAVALTAPDRIAEIIGHIIGGISKAVATAGREVDAIAEVQRTARAMPRRDLWPLIVLAIMAMILFFVFGPQFFR